MQKFVVILLILCNKSNKLFCDATEIIDKKVFIDIESVDKKLILNRTKFEINTINKTDHSYSDEPEEKNEKDSNKELKTKSYEVFEDVIESEYVPLPYHIQNQIPKLENKTNDEELQTAESKYNVPLKVTHTYQVTEDINEDEENENDIDSKVPINERNYPQKFNNHNIDHSYYNEDKKEDNNGKQPLSIIVLRPIARKSQDEHPVNVKVLKPVVLSSERDYETGNILINNKPILTLTAVKSYTGNYKRFDYQNRHSEIAEDNKGQDYKPILINVLKSKHEKDNRNTHDYKNLYQTLLNDGYKKTYYDNEHKSGSNTERYKSNEDDYENENVNEHTYQESSEQSLKKNNNPDNPRQLFIYVVNKKKPYAYVRRANKHR